jgi:hypothetical protein
LSVSRERHILESAVAAVADQAAKASALLDKAVDAEVDGSHPSRSKRRRYGWNCYT